MNASTPKTSKQRFVIPSPAVSPIQEDSGITDKSVDSVVTFKIHADATESISDDDTLLDTMSELDDLKRDNAKLHLDMQSMQHQFQASIDKLTAQLHSATTKIGELDQTTRRDDTRDMSDLCSQLSRLATQLESSPKDRSPSVNKGPQVSLPRFDGSIYSSYEKWKRYLEVYFDYFGWTADAHGAQRAHAIPTILDGYAHVKFFALPIDKRGSYTEIMKELEESFSMTKKPLSLRRNFMRRKQKYSESVREFSADILQRFADCNPPIETQVDTYCAMLLPEIAAEIQDDEYMDMKT